MRFITLILGQIVIAFSVRAQIPPNIIDFDRSVGFSTPRSIIVYPSAQGTDQVYLIPNGLQVADMSSSSRAVGLTHSGITKSGHLVLRLIPTINGIPIPEIVSELRAQFPNIRFAYPGLKSSRFEVTGPGFETVSTTTTRADAADPIASDFVRSILLPPIALRALLTPRSYQLSVLAVSAEYNIRGMSRDSSGKPILEDRIFRVSTTVEGFCALSPGAALDALKGTSGCILPKYDPNMIRRMQTILRGQSLYAGRLDGSFGPATEAAVRGFQRKNKLTIDGIPSPELLEFMEPIPVARRP